MSIIGIEGLSHRYGNVVALNNITLSIPKGSIVALLGPNGSGKTTLLRAIMGMLRPIQGELTVLGKPVTHLKPIDKTQIGYVAEGQRLPDWMTLRSYMKFLRPLYPGWDPDLAEQLRARFQLDENRKLRGLSRGESMKAALLCALAPRPALLVMDEPFAGMDTLVRDDLTRGLLEAAGSDDWTVLIASHDVDELEPLVDRVAVLNDGKLVLNDSVENVQARYRHVELQSAVPADTIGVAAPRTWLGLERSGSRVAFVLDDASGAPLADHLDGRIGAVRHMDERPATLREVFVALTRGSGALAGQRRKTA